VLVLLRSASPASPDRGAIAPLACTSRTRAQPARRPVDGLRSPSRWPQAGSSTRGNQSRPACGRSSAVEHHLAKVEAAGPIPVVRSQAAQGQQADIIGSRHTPAAPSRADRLSLARGRKCGRNNPGSPRGWRNGRRARFRPVCSKERKGSNPFSRTYSTWRVNRTGEPGPAANRDALGDRRGDHALHSPLRALEDEPDRRAGRAWKACGRPNRRWGSCPSASAPWRVNRTGEPAPPRKRLGVLRGAGDHALHSPLGVMEGAPPVRQRILKIRGGQNGRGGQHLRLPLCVLGPVAQVGWSCSLIRRRTVVQIHPGPRLVNAAAA
jgi:hypothetical protein